MIRPTRVEPVKFTRRIAGMFDQRLHHLRRPRPGALEMAFSTPGGQTRALATASMIRAWTRGRELRGLHNHGVAAGQRRGDRADTPRITGAFQGAMASTTPDRLPHRHGGGAGTVGGNDLSLDHGWSATAASTQHVGSQHDVETGPRPRSRRSRRLHGAWTMSSPCGRARFSAAASSLAPAGRRGRSGRPFAERRRAAASTARMSSSASEAAAASVDHVAGDRVRAR